MDVLIISIISILIFIVLFLALREFFCWYWKINQRIELQKETLSVIKGLSLSTCRISALSPTDLLPGGINTTEPTAGDLLKLQQTTGPDAIRFAKKLPTAWLCVCGANNFLQADQCVRCKRYRDVVLERFTYEAFNDPILLKLEPLPEELIRLKKALGDDVVRFASIIEESWYCVCGKLNPLDVQQCPRCNRFKSFVLDKYTREAFSGN